MSAFNKLENCNDGVKLGKELKFSMVGIGGKDFVDGNKKLILNCGQLTYISSMGVGILVQVHSRMKKIGGEVKLAAVQSGVAQILSVVGFNRIFHIYCTVDEAIAAHGG